MASRSLALITLPCSLIHKILKLVLLFPPCIYDAPRLTKKDYVSQDKLSFIVGSKVRAILLDWWILSISEVASRRVSDQLGFPIKKYIFLSTVNTSNRFKADNLHISLIFLS